MPSGSIVQFRPTIGFAFETVTVSNSAVSLTAATYAPAGGVRAEKAFITTEGEIRYRYDNNDPTASVGHILKDGNFLILTGIHQIQMFRAIRNSTTDATLEVTYERE